MSLGDLGTAAATEALVAHLTTGDESVLTAILSSLGRIGDATALAAIERVDPMLSGVAAERAAFAASLIAHRLDLPGHPLPHPAGRQAHDEPPTKESDDQECHRLRITRADPADAELCLRSLARRPLGAELLEEPMYQLRCGRNRWMAVLTRGLGVPGGVERLVRRKSLPAVVAQRDPATGRYVASFLVLSSPDEKSGGAHLFVHRVDGGQISAGRVRVEGDAGTFWLHPVEGPRPYTLSMAGRVDAGGLVFTTAIATRGEKRAVSREHPDVAHGIPGVAGPMVSEAF
jgi:hypothetical protein